MLPTGYEIKQIPRQGKSAGYGGVALIHKANSSVKVTDSSLTNKYSSFEHLECRVRIDTSDFLLTVVYRPPPSKSNKQKTSTFFDQWPLFLDRYSEVATTLVITGDINFHLEDSKNRDAEHFSSLLGSYGMQQHVMEPTHKRGHTLDMVVARDVDNILYG